MGKTTMSIPPAVGTLLVSIVLMFALLRACLIWLYQIYCADAQYQVEALARAATQEAIISNDRTEEGVS